jgi:transcriptional regulator with XRE-family HTH domain
MLTVYRLKEWRNKRVLTQRELAEKSGVSLDTVTRLDKVGEAQPRTIRKLAEALGITTDELIGEPTAAK